MNHGWREHLLSPETVLNYCSLFQLTEFNLIRSFVRRRNIQMSIFHPVDFTAEHLLVVFVCSQPLMVTSPPATVIGQFVRPVNPGISRRHHRRRRLLPVTPIGVRARRLVRGSSRLNVVNGLTWRCWTSPTPSARRRRVPAAAPVNNICINTTVGSYDVPN